MTISCLRYPPAWFEESDEIILEYIHQRQPTSPAPLEDFSSHEYDEIFDGVAFLEASGLIASRQTDVYSVTEKRSTY